MSVQVDITASAVIELTYEQYAYFKDYADNTGQRIERIIADESALWWRQFEEEAHITVEDVSLTSDPDQ